MFQPLDGPALHTSLSITNGVVSTLKVGSSELDERGVLTVQPRNGDLYVYFDDGSLSAPSVATVQSQGIIVYEQSLQSFDCTNRQRLYGLGVNGTVTVTVVERA